MSITVAPVHPGFVAEISGVDEPTTRSALKLLTNRSIVVPRKGEEKYALVPMVAGFIRNASPEIVRQVREEQVVQRGVRQHHPDKVVARSHRRLHLPVLRRQQDDRTGAGQLDRDLGSDGQRPSRPSPAPA